MNKIIIIGGVGNGSVIASAIEDANKKGDHTWEFEGYLNDRVSMRDKIEGKPVLGSISDIQKFIDEGYYFIYTIYKIGGNTDRLSLFNNLGIPETQLATFVHPSAYVAENVDLGPGTVIMPKAMISPGVKTGIATLIMVGASLGHNTTCGNHCHFAAQSCVGAYCSIGDGVHVGLNATIRENVVLESFATLGMGSVLLENIPKGEIWVGNPANKIVKD